MLSPSERYGLAAEKRIYEATDIKFGTNLNTLFQGLSDNKPGTDEFGMASFISFVATWDGWRKGCPDQGGNHALELMAAGIGERPIHLRWETSDWAA